MAATEASINHQTDPRSSLAERTKNWPRNFRPRTMTTMKLPPTSRTGSPTVADVPADNRFSHNGNARTRQAHRHKKNHPIRHTVLRNRPPARLPKKLKPLPPLPPSDIKVVIRPREGLNLGAWRTDQVVCAINAACRFSPERKGLTIRIRQDQNLAIVSTPDESVAARARELPGITIDGRQFEV
ncbi:hypothetical protein HPB47_019135 [Ixodes persulcatus]|uniref:Uncharacterized protein n=1 Tax=Ixodes persulcatus TaxID=34615 RepID=A0AC60QJ14_IXOPE|nr:hypothetical protein HPB47_019135 [Ixodes persulcatus]